MSFDAMVDACARILRKEGYEGLTTNHIAKVAGVGIGTLYDFFPDKESIVAVLAEKVMADSLAKMQAAFAECRSLGPWASVVRLTEQGVANVVEERALIRVRCYSLEKEERSLGRRGIAAPFFDLAGEAAAGISVSGPLSRMLGRTKRSCDSFNRRPLPCFLPRDAGLSAAAPAVE